MPLELVVPEVGESITEVEIGQWLRKQGDAVAKDDPVVEIETDKVTLELPAPADGTISRLLKKQGEAAKVGDVIGYMEAGDAPVQPRDDEPATKKPEANPKDAEPRITPAARRMLEQNNLSAADVKPTGPGGRLLKEDIQRRLDDEAASPHEAAPPQRDLRLQRGGETAEPELEPAPAAKPQAAPTSGGGAREEELVPMSPMRRRIAQRLVEAQHTGALLTTFNEIDMSAVMALRAKYKDAFAKRYDIKLGFMSFFVKATIDALKQLPQLNAEVRGTDILYRNYYDIGIAIGSGKGLVVPVLRNAERMSFAEIERAIADYAEQVRTNKLKLEDLRGGTFTITNGGVFGSLLSTPIINPPQSGVLGMHAIQKRPIVIDDQVVVRPMMYVALTYDHRLVDGREAVTFLVRVKEAVEDPSRMLMEV